jgi:hypothetical protein
MAARQRFTSAPFVTARLWQKMFYELSHVGTHYENSFDSTALKRTVQHGVKKGPRPSAGHKPGWLRDKNPCGD